MKTFLPPIAPFYCVLNVTNLSPVPVKPVVRLHQSDPSEKNVLWFSPALHFTPQPHWDLHQHDLERGWWKGNLCLVKAIIF